MRLLVNGDQRELADGATVAAVLDALDLVPGRRGVAVAVDAEVIPRARWEEHALHEGQQVEVVAAIQGGA